MISNLMIGDNAILSSEKIPWKCMILVPQWNSAWCWDSWYKPTLHFEYTLTLLRRHADWGIVRHSASFLNVRECGISWTMSQPDRWEETAINYCQLLLSVAHTKLGRLRPIVGGCGNRRGLAWISTRHQLRIRIPYSAESNGKDT